MTPFENFIGHSVQNTRKQRWILDERNNTAKVWLAVGTSSALGAAVQVPKLHIYDMLFERILFFLDINANSCHAIFSKSVKYFPFNEGGLADSVFPTKTDLQSKSVFFLHSMMD